MENQLTDCHFNEVQAARYLGKSPRWVQYQLTRPNPPPSFKVGKSRLFRKSELDAWLEQFRAGSNLDQIVDDVMADLGGGQ
jgi:excisionase family DNA binding protein